MFKIILLVILSLFVLFVLTKLFPMIIRLSRSLFNSPIARGFIFQAIIRLVRFL